LDFQETEDTHDTTHGSANKAKLSDFLIISTRESQGKTARPQISTASWKRWERRRRRRRETPCLG